MLWTRITDKGVFVFRDFVVGNLNLIEDVVKSMGVMRCHLRIQQYLYFSLYENTMRNKISRHNPTIQVSHSISQIRILCLYLYAVSASATQKK